MVCCHSRLLVPLRGAYPKTSDRMHEHFPQISGNSLSTNELNSHLPRNRPGSRPEWRTKIMPDSRQRDIDNKEIDVEHEQTKAGCNQRQPLGRRTLSHEESSRPF